MMVILNKSLTYQHDCDFLPWRQQLEAQALRYRDQTMLIVRVEAVTFLLIFQCFVHEH